MGTVKTLFSGWKECDFEQYKEAYTLLGGCTSAHPNIISFLDRHLDEKLFFYIKRTETSIQGAYFSFNKNKLVENMQTRYPFSYDEIIFPIARNAKLFLPVKSKRLSPIHKDNFINTSHHPRLNKRKICLIKDNFSYKTRRNRSNEINKFKRAGGEIRSSSEFMHKNWWTSISICTRNVGIITTLKSKKSIYLKYIQSFVIIYLAMCYLSTVNLVLTILSCGRKVLNGFHLMPLMVVMTLNMHTLVLVVF
ncbi:hypothetical protein XENE109146_12270 [Xenorhabdus nematophila]